MKYFHIALIILSSCVNSSKKDERIILVSGFSMDPSDPRFGLELNPGEIFYCEEIMNSGGKYNYYRADLGQGVFDGIKAAIVANFDKRKPFKPIVDARPYELFLSINGKDDNFKFYGNSLSDNQFAVFDKILSLRNITFERIDYYEFSQELLHEKSPGSFYGEK